MITNIKDWKKVNEMISPYYTWEGQLIQLMEDAFEMTHSDASGILMANQDEYERYFYDGKTIQEVLEIIKAKVLSEKLDKPGQEDIDMNNDGKVDKSDFYLLNKRRKIKKAMKKESFTGVSKFNIYWLLDNSDEIDGAEDLNIKELAEQLNKLILNADTVDLETIKIEENI